MVNFESYYKNECGWNGGPHLFIDDRAIWVFNDLTKRGTHSPSFNASRFGIEMLGDYDKEEFNSGRGRKVRDNTVAAMAILNNRLGFAAAESSMFILGRDELFDGEDKAFGDSRNRLRLPFRVWSGSEKGDNAAYIGV